MSVITYYQSASMLSPYVWYGQLTGVNPNSISLSDYAGRSGTYYGSFRYNYYGITGGTLTGYDNYVNNSIEYTATGLNVAAKSAYNYIQGNKPADLMKAALSKDDNVYGSASDDVLAGYNGNDTIYGQYGDDRVYGMIGNDKLYGGDGKDTLIGAEGNDYLNGGNGADILFGGVGRDTFVFEQASDTGIGPNNRDYIADFQKKLDQIDLSAIDANQFIEGDQAFSFIGSNDFSGSVGQLRFSGGVISADTNGDRSADFEIGVAGTSNLTASNFKL